MNRLPGIVLLLFPLTAMGQTPGEWYLRETGTRLPPAVRRSVPDSLFSGSFFRCRTLPESHPARLLAESSRLACLSDELSAIHTRITIAHGETGNRIRLAKLLFDVRRQAAGQYAAVRRTASGLPVFRKRLQAWAIDGPSALTRFDAEIASLLGTSPPPIVP